MTRYRVSEFLLFSHVLSPVVLSVAVHPLLIYLQFAALKLLVCPLESRVACNRSVALKRYLFAFRFLCSFDRQSNLVTGQMSCSYSRSLNVRILEHIVRIYVKLLCFDMRTLLRRLTDE